jgi:hypothetical protein
MVGEWQVKDALSLFNTNSAVNSKLEITVSAEDF